MSAIANANAVKVLTAAHASGTDDLTVLQWFDAKGVAKNIQLASTTSLVYRKSAAGAVGYSVKFADGEYSDMQTIETTPNIFLFANTAKHQHDGKFLIGGHWVSNATEIGAECIKFQMNPFPGMRQNPKWLTTSNQQFGEKGVAGTSNSNSASSCVTPKTFLTLIPGAIVSVKPKAKAKVVEAAAKVVEAAAKVVAAPKAKAKAIIVSLASIKKKGGSKVKASKRVDVYDQVLAHSTGAQLKDILNLYEPGKWGNKVSGKTPAAEVMRTIRRTALRKIWKL